MRTEAIEQGTGISWPDWLAYFERIGAKDLDHAELARRIEADHDGVSGWWAQSVTIHFEQQMGRRVVGETSDGFAANASKTLATDKDGALDRWLDLVGDPDEVDGVPVERRGETSSTEKWRYWRAALADGSKVQVTISDKPGGKVTLAVQHSGLESEADRERWRGYWKARLAEL